MNRRSIGIVLIIAGVLLFLWAGAQISNFMPDAMMPYTLKQAQEQTRIVYNALQCIGAVAAIGGGILIFLKKKGSPPA